jgi:LysM repeat protein
MKTDLITKLFTLLLFGASNAIADDIQGQLDSIILIDESSNSSMKNHTIVGCDDTLKINELQCSRERGTDPFLTSSNRLPISDQVKKQKDKDMVEIEKKLKDIYQQLIELQTVKEDNVELKEKLRKMTLLMSQDSSKRSNAKEILVLQVNDDHVIIKVQAGESLSKYAQKYYGDSRKYHAIQRANPSKIDKTLQVFIGDELIIPTSISFKYKEEKEEIIISEEDTIPVGESVNIEEVEYIGNSDIIYETQEKSIKIKVDKGVDIFQLSAIYYGDEKDYYRIYNANKSVIGGDLKIKEDMELVIPIIE